MTRVAVVLEHFPTPYLLVGAAPPKGVVPETADVHHISVPRGGVLGLTATYVVLDDGSYRVFPAISDPHLIPEGRPMPVLTWREVAAVGALACLAE